MPGLKDIPGNHSARVNLPVMAGATTDDEFVVFVAPANVKLTGVKIVPTAAITHDGTNYTTLSVRNRKADASGTALPFARSYIATDAVALVDDGANAPASGTAADLLVASGDVVTVQRKHTGTGLVLPVATVEVNYQYR